MRVESVELRVEIYSVHFVHWINRMKAKQSQLSTPNSPLYFN